MAELKTKPTRASVRGFLAAVDNAQRRADALTVLAMLADITGHAPRMWGPSIVGFDRYHYKYASGREGDMCMAGFSPRREALTIYIMPGFPRYDGLMARLGKYTTGKSCLYIKKLSDVNQDVLRELLAEAYAHMKQTYGSSA